MKKMRFYNRIRQWFWWNFKATEEQKVKYDCFFRYGVGIIKNGKRISPNDFYLKE